jgi:hypothetical protein
MMDNNTQTVLNIFRAIEQRESGSASVGRLPDSCIPKLNYAGRHRSRTAAPLAGSIVVSPGERFGTPCSLLRRIGR